MRVFMLAVGYGGLVVAPGGRGEGLVATRPHVRVPNFPRHGRSGDDA